MKDRLYLFDNIKAILIFLVVLGHLIEPFINIEKPYLVLYCIIYTFHMPLFALVSGFFSKVPKKEEIYNLVKLFLVFEFIYAIIMFLAIYFRPEQMQVLTGQPAILGSILENLYVVLSPIWMLWYLLALISWKLLLHIFKRSPWLIIIAIIMAMLVGTIDISGRALSFQRTFCIFPFFLMGYYVNLDQVVKIKNSIFSKVFVMITIAISFFIVPKIVELGPKILYFADNYNELGMTFTMGITVRSLLLLYAAMLCISVIILTPSKKKIYSYIGKHTIGIFLLHGIILVMLLSLGTFIYLEQFCFIINMFFCVAMSIFICYILGKEQVTKKILLITMKKRKRAKDDRIST
ncbi:MAG: acyltransferase family protein [Mycoplasmatales bacterium]